MISKTQVMIRTRYDTPFSSKGNCVAIMPNHSQFSHIKHRIKQLTVCDRCTLSEVVAPDPILDASLFPGGATEGWEVLKVATGEQKLVVIFEPLFSFGDDATRFLAVE